MLEVFDLAQALFCFFFCIVCSETPARFFGDDFPLMTLLFDHKNSIAKNRRAIPCVFLRMEEARRGFFAFEFGLSLKKVRVKCIYYKHHVKVV